MAFTPSVETTGNSAGATSLACNVPSNVNGSILFLLIGLNNASGYVPNSGLSGIWTELAKYEDNADKYYLYYRIAASEPASYTIGFSGTTKIRLTMSCYTAGDWNVNSGVSDFTISNTSYRTSDSNIIAAGINVPYAKSPIVYFGSLYNTGNGTFTPPSTIGSDSWIDDYDNRNSTSDFLIQIAYVIWQGSGASGNVTAVSTLTSQTTKHAKPWYFTHI